VSDDDDAIPALYGNGSLPPSDPNEHQPGAIVRIRMTNFVTYSSAEFKCGPSLNMIIGPNGTGKSTLVCAICLGLGWPPSCLGRAKEIGEFVKNGHREAEIEVELKAGPIHSGRNRIVKRVIKRDGNKSTWFLNGRPCSHKEVRKLMRYFHIQVDNLCQFLPQDKVVEFAAMNPVQLLEQTQKAVAADQVSEWHETLKALGASREGLTRDKESKVRLLADLNNRQQQQRSDVERMTERQQVEFRKTLLQKALPMFQYTEKKNQYEEARVRRNQAVQELDDLKEQVEPSLRDITEKKEYEAKIAKVYQQKNALVESMNQRVNTICVDLNTENERHQQGVSSIEAEKERGKRVKEDMARQKVKVARLKNLLDDPPPEFDAAKYNDEIAAKTREFKAVQNEMMTIQGEIRGLVMQANAKTDEQAAIQQDLDEGSTQAGQQKQMLQKKSMDSYKAWQWLQDETNQKMFEGQVYGPPLLTCSVKTLEYADAIESTLRASDFITFTVTNERDLRTFSNAVSGRQGLSLHDIHIQVASRPLSAFPAPVSNQELQRLGFDGWLLDGLSGPEPVLAMLCGSSRLHRTAFTPRSQSESEFEQVSKSKVQSWVAKEGIYTIQTRAEYQASSTSTRPINKARYWKDQQIDQSSQSELKKKFSELANELDQIKQKGDEKKHNYQERAKESNRLKAETVSPI
jgi:chromosome segregation ATPase